jgi:hypothetical protein
MPDFLPRLPKVSAASVPARRQFKVGQAVPDLNRCQAQPDLRLLLPKGQYPDGHLVVVTNWREFGQLKARYFGLWEAKPLHSK